MHGLKAAGIDLNRKVLADVALHDDAAFRRWSLRRRRLWRKHEPRGTGNRFAQQPGRSHPAGRPACVALAAGEGSRLEEAAEAKAEAARLADEVKTLQAERKQVRSRIEKLLGQIDQLSAS